TSENEASHACVKVPLTYYGYNAHGKRAWMLRFKYGTDYTHLGQHFPLPLHPDAEDQYLITRYDFLRDLKLTEQDAEGVLWRFTYTATRKPARSFHPLTNWNNTEPMVHVDEINYEYTLDDHPYSSVVKRDGEVKFITFSVSNTFGE